MTRHDSHLYTIGPDQGYFHCGTAGDGKQVLLGRSSPGLVALFFDDSGDFLGHEARRLEPLRRSIIVAGVPVEVVFEHYEIHDERIDPRLRAWRDELEFRDLTIRVRKFSIPALGISIEDEPGHFGEILEDPEASEADRDEVRGAIADWYRAGQFVLIWGNDYWLDSTGEVVSS